MRVKLAICLPHQGEVKFAFCASLAQMSCYCMSKLFFEGFEREAVMLDRMTSNLPRSRQELLEDALLQDCTHALFIDSDQRFPQDTAHRLLAHNKPVVACNIPLKTAPSFPTARSRTGTPFGAPINSNAPHGSPPPQGLEKVWRVGSGVMMIDLSILSKIEKPWFELRYNKEHHQFVGEDWYFVEKVQQAGFEVFIDHDLSRMIGHVGTFEYTHAHIPALEVEEAA